MSPSQIEIMEFLFYKRSIGKDAAKFYERVKELFLAQHKIGITDPDFLKKVTDAIKKLKGATEIKELFRKVLKEKHIVDAEDRAIENMNTTAICCLHRNLPGIYRLVNLRHDERRGSGRLENILKINGVKVSHITREYYMRHFYMNHRFLRDRYSSFPNTLLTSDSFLKTNEEVDKFIERYSNYWNDFFLAQVPHHGSRHSSDRTLFSKFRLNELLFINYGINHHFVKRWRHPSAETINELIITGHSSNILPVHEHNGIRFCFELFNSEE